MQLPARCPDEVQEHAHTGARSSTICMPALRPPHTKDPARLPTTAVHLHSLLGDYSQNPHHDLMPHSLTQLASRFAGNTHTHTRPPFPPVSRSSKPGVMGIGRGLITRARTDPCWPCNRDEALLGVPHRFMRFGVLEQRGGVPASSAKESEHSQ